MVCPLLAGTSGSFHLGQDLPATLEDLSCRCSFFRQRGAPLTRGSLIPFQAGSLRTQPVNAGVITAGCARAKRKLRLTPTQAELLSATRAVSTCEPGDRLRELILTDR